MVATVTDKVGLFMGLSFLAMFALIGIYNFSLWAWHHMNASTVKFTPKVQRDVKMYSLGMAASAAILDETAKSLLLREKLQAAYPDLPLAYDIASEALLGTAEGLKREAKKVRDSYGQTKG